MSIGVVLVGVALILVAAAYVARPFRVVRTDDDLDGLINAWVAQVWDEGVELDTLDEAATVTAADLAEEGDAIAFCPQCGRQVSPDDRFCAGCGTRLRGGTE